MSGDLVAGELRAFRAWRVGATSFYPMTVGLHGWDAATATAACRLAGHRAPCAGCACGLYAYYRSTTVTTAPGTAFGVVSVRGRVILASRGLKAEHMIMLAVATADERASAMADRYGLPVYPGREALLSDYPPQDYSELVEVDPTDPPDVYARMHAGLGLAQAAAKAAIRLRQAAQRLRGNVAAHG
jgi:hypothetical protein